jgi:protein subunit release factor A
MQHWIKLDINATTSVLSFKYNPTAIAILFCFSTQEEEKQNKNKKDNTTLLLSKTTQYYVVHF